MHKILLYIISTLLAIAAFACGETHYDARLTAIDSIIDVSPDSALAELRALDYKSLSGSDNRAYYALLLTQARYKCYDSIPSTDTIEIAVTRFTSNGDREKLTRSLIYKGATLEELDYLAEAMSSYKQAEAVAIKSDFKNLGYINLRIAKLYHSSYSVGREYIERYKKALSYFERANELNYQLKTLSKLGAIYCYSNIDSAYIYTNRAIELSKELNDSTFLFENYEILSRAYWVDSQYTKQKKIDLYNIKHGSRFISSDSYFDIIRAYSKLGKPDSAAIFLQQLNTTGMSKAEYVSYLMSLREYYIAIGDYKRACIVSEQDAAISDSIMNSQNYNSISKAETEYVIKNAELAEQIANLKFHYFIILSVIIITSLILLVFFMKTRYRNTILSNQILVDNLKKDYTQMEAIHNKTIQDLEEKRKIIAEDDYSITSLQHAFDSQFENVKQLMKLAENADALSPAALRRNINSIIFAKQDDSETEKLLNLVNLRYNSIITRIREKHPNLSDNEIKFIALVCLGYPNSYICFYMGYTNKQSVVNKKQIVGQKMGNVNLMDYLELLKNEHY